MRFTLLIFMFALLISCSEKNKIGNDNAPNSQNNENFDWNSAPDSKMDSLVHKYTPFTLQADLSELSDNQKKMISTLIEAGDIMNELFWYEAYGKKDSLLNNISNSSSRKFVEKLVASNATGIIATHDLSLCEVAKQLPQIDLPAYDTKSNGQIPVPSPRNGPRFF